MNYEIIGLAATVFVLVSFLSKNIKIVRAVNIVGASLFVVYGLLIGSYSVWIMNALLIVVHIWHLVKGRNKRSNTSK